VQRRGFYAWFKEPESILSKENTRFEGLIETAYKESAESYGSPRICRDLREKAGRCSENRLDRLMKAQGIKAIRRYCKPRYRYLKPALLTPNTLNREFIVAGADLAWVTDIT
jgi:putative transposase